MIIKLINLSHLSAYSLRTLSISYLVNIYRRISLIPIIITLNQIKIEQGRCNACSLTEKEVGENRRKRCVVDGRLATHEAATTDSFWVHQANRAVGETVLSTPPLGETRTGVPASPQTGFVEFADFSAECIVGPTRVDCCAWYLPTLVIKQ